MPDFDIDLGDLNKRVNWQRNTRIKAPNSAGQPLDHWTDQGQFWAKVEPLSGRELWTARQLQAKTTHRIIIRQVGPIRPDDRFELVDPVYGIRYLYVEAVHRVDELNEFFLIEASEPKDHP